MKNSIPAYLLHNEPANRDDAKLRRGKLSFVDKTILNTSNAVKLIYLQSESTSIKSILSRVSPHVKFISLLVLVVVISIVRSAYLQLSISAFILILYFLSRLKVMQIYRKIIFLSLFFGFIVVLPASLNIFTPGRNLVTVYSFQKPVSFLIYKIPQTVAITDNGLNVVILIFLRVLNSVSFSLLIVFTTQFSAFIKSFKLIGIPDTFLMIISLAYKYIFILSRTIGETYLALKSRLSGHLEDGNLRKIISGRVFFIFKRSVRIYEGTYYAMVSRGYTGKIKLYSDRQFKSSDLIALSAILSFGLVILLIDNNIIVF
jgi:cobalt/nickel transport system permease protein